MLLKMARKSLKPEPNLWNLWNGWNRWNLGSRVLAEVVQERRDDQRVREVDEKRADHRNDEEGFRRLAVALDQRRHVGHRVRGGAEHEPDEAAGHHGGF